MGKSRGANQTSRRVSGPLALDGGEPYCRAPSMRSTLLTPASSPCRNKMILVPFSEQTVEKDPRIITRRLARNPTPLGYFDSSPRSKCQASRYAAYFCRLLSGVKCNEQFVRPINANGMMYQTSIGIR
jgi:hypothetical protein